MSIPWALLVVAGVLGADVGGALAIDPRREQPVFAVAEPGGGPFAAREAGPTRARGRHEVREDEGRRRLVLQQAPPWGDAVALWSAAGDVGDAGDVIGLLGDGLVRARFVAGATATATLLLRADVEAGPESELERGYGVVVAEGRVALWRWDHRVGRPLGAAVPLSARVRAGASFEVVILAVGPWLSAEVFDDDLRSLARVTATDGGGARGLVGVRLPRASRPTGLLSLSVGGAAAAGAAGEGGDDDDDDDDDDNDDDDVFGAERFVAIAASDLPRVPPALRRKVVQGAVDADVDGAAGGDVGGPRVLLALDPVGVERLRRAGVVVRDQRGHWPWKAVDPGLQRRLAHPSTRSAAIDAGHADDSYKDPVLVEQALRALAKRAPGLTRLVELGRSHGGRPIWALLVSDHADVDEDEPSVLLDGGHHGNELLSIEAVLDAASQLLSGYGRDAELTRVVDGAAVWCVPLVNPDGNDRFVHVSRDGGRKNGRPWQDGDATVDGAGVDLYRNYPVGWGGLGEVGSRSAPSHHRYRGPRAASEPEVQAMMALAERERFVASIDYHSNSTKILVPYTDPSWTNPAPNEGRLIAEGLAATLPQQTNGRRYAVARNLYPVDGTAQDWLRFAHGTVALLVELPEHNPLPFRPRRDANLIPGRGIWRGLLRHVVDGPGVVVHVVDVDGRPVPAVVSLAGQDRSHGERWTARARDGRHQRLWPGPGRVVVVVEHDGRRSERVVDLPARGLVDVRVVQGP